MTIKLRYLLWKQASFKIPRMLQMYFPGFPFVERLPGSEVGPKLSTRILRRLRPKKVARLLKRIPIKGVE